MARQVYNDTWASGGDKVDPGGVKTTTGWVVEAPPHEYFNFWQGRTDEMLQHLERNGISTYNSSTVYDLGGYAREGTVSYRSLVVSNTGNLPSTSPAQWVQAFLIPGNNLSDLSDVSAARTNLSVYSRAESDSNFLDSASNLSDLANAATARTNLGVYSTTQSDANYLGASAKAVDSELLDGVDGTTYARKDQANTLQNTLTITKSAAESIVVVDSVTGQDSSLELKENGVLRGKVVYDESLDVLNVVKYGTDGSSVKGNLQLFNNGDIDVTVGTLKQAGNPVYHSGNDGAGSGVDADLLDGVEGSGYGQLDVKGSWTKAQRYVPSILTDGATISWDLDVSPVASVVIAGNRTVNAPSNIEDGKVVLLRVRQDGVGNRTLAWNAAFDFGTSGAPVLSTGANLYDYITFIGRGTTVLDFLGVKTGY